MSTAVARQVHCKAESEVRNGIVDFSLLLEQSELILGTPTAVISPAGLSLSGITVTTDVREVLGHEVAIGKAVLFRASDGTAGVEYKITFTLNTDASPAQTLVRSIILKVVED